MNIYLTGGWGYGNLGDDAILRATRTSLGRTFPDLVLQVSSYNPDETRQHHDLDTTLSLHARLETDGTSPLRVVWRALRLLAWTRTRRSSWLPGVFQDLVAEVEACDLVILGGGGYFNDRWKRSMLARWLEILVAKTLGKKVMLYGQTVGPFTSLWSRLFFGRILRQIDVITYRDASSEKTLRRYHYPAERAHHTADEATLLPACAARERLTRHGVAEGGVVLGVMMQRFRPYVSVSGALPLGRIRNQAQYLDEVVALFSELQQHDLHVAFLPSTSWDVPVCETLCRRLTSTPTLIKPTLIKGVGVAEYVSLCQSVDVMLSTNMHPVILAATAGVPSVALSYSYKVDDFMDSVGLGEYVTRMDALRADVVAAQLGSLITQHSTAQTTLRERFAEVQARAEQNALHAKQLVSTANPEHP